MERLTKRVDQGIPLLESWADNMDPVAIIRRLCDRLAAYEDTCLTPSEIVSQLDAKNEKQNLDHVMMIEDIEQYCGPVSMGTHVLLFNRNKISKEEAIKIVEAGSYSPYVLFIPTKQMNGLFRDVG